MKYTTLISVQELQTHLGDPTWKIVDCRFSLTSPDSKQQEYLQAHIPGAVYAHLDKNLSGRVILGKTGRHPLPDIDRLARFFSQIGIDESIQVVAYDDAGGSSAAVRLWWLLRWMGHTSVAVLDGGWQEWLQAGYLVKCGREKSATKKFTPHLRPELVVISGDDLQQITDSSVIIVDARSNERYIGENEPIDPIAGHIPGALNAPHQENLDDQGRFLTKEQLRQRYLELLGEVANAQVIFYCGSGVTACHDILAFQHAGLGEARLYAGSWSEWITSGERPIAIEDNA